MQTISRREFLKGSIVLLTCLPTPRKPPSDFDDDELGIDENGIIIRPPLTPKVKQ